MSILLDNWNLPKGGSTIRWKNRIPTGDNLRDAKNRVEQIWLRLKENENDEQLQKGLEIAKIELMQIRNKLIYEKLEEIKTRPVHSEDEENIDPFEISYWNPTKSETLVSHMIWASDDFSENPKSFFRKPLNYILREPKEKHGMNLIEMYNRYDSENHNINEAGEKILFSLKNFMDSHAGELLVDQLRNNPETLKQMKRVRKCLDFVCSKIEKSAFDEEQPQRMEVHYENFADTDASKIFHATYKSQGKVAEITISRGYISVNDLEPKLYPDEIQYFVNKTMQDDYRDSFGLFVRIFFYKIDGPRNSGHYLFLSEYNKTRVKMNFSFGLEEQFTKEKKDLQFSKNLYEHHEYSVQKSLSDFYKNNLQQLVTTNWKIPRPFTEEEMIMKHMEFMDKNFQIIERDKVQPWGEFVSSIQKKFYANKPASIPDPVQTFFFSGDSFAFFVTIISPYFSFSRDLVDMQENNGEKYICITTIRYPILSWNVEKTMRRLLRSFYEKENTDGSLSWDVWKKQIFQPHFFSKKDRYNPEEFQAIPEPDELPDGVNDDPVEDTNRRETHPLRLLTSLPYQASYAFMVKRRTARERDEDVISNTSFYLNDMDDDRNVVYEYRTSGSNESNGAWDYLQLFRINAEIKVSREAASYGMKTFFEFRKEQPEGTKVGLFREYLKLEHEGRKVLMEAWREIWSEEIQKPGWILHENKREERNQERQPRHRNQHQHRQPQNRHQPRPNPERRQPDSDDSQPQYLTTAEKNALHDKMLYVNVYQLKKATQAVKNWLWHNVGYRSTRDLVELFAVICREVNKASKEDTTRFTSILNATNHNLTGNTPEEKMKQLLRNIYSYIRRGEQTKRQAHLVKRGKEVHKNQRNVQINRHKQQHTQPGQGRRSARPGLKATIARQINRRFLVTQLYQSA